LVMGGGGMSKSDEFLV
jgi:hypothetical protein